MSSPRLLSLVALLALGCAGAGDAAIDADVPGVVAAPAAVWLPVEHPAAAAQAHWGLPIPCSGLRVVETPLAELQPLCNSAAELAERAATLHTDACVMPGRCEIAIAAGLDPARRELALAHELGHLLARRHGHVQDGCPLDAPGAALMCELGPSSGSPEPTSADFDLVLR